MFVNAYDPSILGWETETRGLLVQAQSGQFISLVKSCLKNFLKEEKNILKEQMV